jgi:hypothetical protein
VVVVVVGVFANKSNNENGSMKAEIEGLSGMRRKPGADDSLFHARKEDEQEAITVQSRLATQFYFMARVKPLQDPAVGAV